MTRVPLIKLKNFLSRSSAIHQLVSRSSTSCIPFPQAPLDSPIWIPRKRAEWLTME